MAILFEGASALTGAPIVVIATGYDNPSDNEKTGDMVQVWIMHATTHPIEASRKGLDSAVCGSCLHMGAPDPDKESGWAKGRGCYVNLGLAPSSIWNTYRSGRYDRVTPAEFAGMVKGRALRLGAYGDPAAVPAGILAPACEAAAYVTAYSHQWRNPGAAWLKSWAMASADSESEAAEASAAGWRYFRVRPLDGPTMSGEVICPASKEAGQKTVCAKCRACGGQSSKARASIVIMDHGPQKKKRNAVFTRKVAA